MVPYNHPIVELKYETKTHVTDAFDTYNHPIVELK